MDEKLEKVLDKILEKDPRYAPDAYKFLLEALDYTTEKLGRHGHVSGQELLDGIRLYGLEQFGPMARLVFEHWGVRTCEDFGEIVFNLIDAGILGKSEEDSKEDFKGGYDFREAFDKGYKELLKEEVSK